MPPKAPDRAAARIPLATKGDLTPIAKRLARMEAIILEMRFEQDAGLKRFIKLQGQVDAIAEGLAKKARALPKRPRPS